MASPRQLRMALLDHGLAQARFQYNLVLAAILKAVERERQSARRRERRWWVESGSYADHFSAITRLSWRNSRPSTMPTSKPSSAWSHRCTMSCLTELAPALPRVQHKLIRILQTKFSPNIIFLLRFNHISFSSFAGIEPRRTFQKLTRSHQKV